MSDYYDSNNIPSTNAFASSATVRREFQLVASEISDKLPTLTGNAIKLFRVNTAGTAQEAITAYESLITTEILTQSDSHRTFGLNLAAGFTVTLPAVADAGIGWKARFRVETAPTGGNYVITEATASDTNVLTGGINELEVDTGDDGPYSAAFTQVNFIANIAAVGDYVDIECNGSRYFINGQTNADGGSTLT